MSFCVCETNIINQKNRFQTEVERKEVTVEANGETGDVHGSSEELNRQESNEAK